MVVFGDARLTQLARYAPKGERLIAAVVNWMNRRDELGAIRAKARQAQPLQYEPDQKNLYRALFAFLAPSLVLVCGLGFWFVRQLNESPPPPAGPTPPASPSPSSTNVSPRKDSSS